MLMEKPPKRWQGMALFGYGFRPFFLFASLFAVLAMALWLGELARWSVLSSDLAPVEWHKHEMLFGYTSAVIAGFLFTAVPNWTGRFPVMGWPLIGIFSLWAIGRLGMLLGGGLSYPIVAVLDILFLPVLALVMGREIWAGNNKRNLKVLIPVGLMAVANIWFHIDIMDAGTGEFPIRLGFACVILLLMLIGGRIIPSFTRNWLAKQQGEKMPVPFSRFDAVAIGFSFLALLAWVFVETAPVVLSGLLAVSGGLQAARLLRWRGHRTLANPLLLVLHIFYAALPIGMALLAAGVWLDDSQLATAALHMFGIGAAGGLTISVMTRASIGHTGRELRADGVMKVMFTAVALSAILRVVGALLPEADWVVTAAGISWIVAFGLFAMKVGPWLATKRKSAGS
ncbi:MAG: NnrS family protein [Rhizobiaceae bacterium]